MVQYKPGMYFCIAIRIICNCCYKNVSIYVGIPIGEPNVPTIIQKCLNKQYKILINNTAKKKK